MSSLVAKLAEGREAAVDLSDVVCPVCLQIFLQPVKMPCHHVLCLSCFQKNVKEATLGCPLCRTRISSWARSAVKSKTLVDKQLWDFITRTFPQQVEAAQAGVDEIDPDEIFPCFAVHQFAEPGDIKSEFDSQLERTREEEREQREREEQLSSDLAGKMEEEEKEEERQRVREAQQQEAADRELARKMWRETTATATPSSSKKRKNPLLDLLKKSAEKKAKLTKTVEKAEATKEDSDVEINWSDEDFLEEQRQIERRLAQEREDGEFARRLQKESRGLFFNKTNETKTPDANSKMKSSKRQLSLMESSSKVSKEAPNGRLEFPADPKLKDKENNSNDKVVPARDLKMIKKKVENDLSSKVNLVPATESINQGQMKSEEMRDQISLDAELAFKLQEELKKESSQIHSPSHKSDSGVVKNVYEVLSESQKSQKKLGSCKNQHNHRSLPCKSCANCMKGNCGVCTSCRDMPQFGGKGQSKQSCVQRKCLKPIKSKCSSC